MSFNGSGTYSAPASSWNPAVDNTDIDASDWIALLADLSTALSTCVLKDGTQTVTANIPMAGFKITGLGAATTNGDALRYATATFTITLTGFDSSVTGTAAYSLSNNVVTLFIPPLTGTSNATTMTATGLPAAITPTTNHAGFTVGATDNGTIVTAQARADVKNDSTIDFFTNQAGAGWTGSGTKALVNGATLTYNLN